MNKDDVYILTDRGMRRIINLMGRPAPGVDRLPLLVDGRRTVSDLVSVLGGPSEAEVLDAMSKLLAEENIELLDPTDLDFTKLFYRVPRATKLTPQHEAKVKKEAASGASELEKKGFYASKTRQLPIRLVDKPGAARTALIIEDDEDMANLVRQMLGLMKFEVRHAATKERVLAELRKQPSPDLVLMDVTLPEVNGFDILARMRNHPQLINLPVVLITAKSKPEEIAHGLKLGADAYLTKPFAPQTLVTGVRSILGLA